MSESLVVNFYEDEITAVVEVEGGRRVVYVPVRPICDYLGVSWTGQRERIMRDPVLSELAATVRVTRTEGTRQVERELLALTLDYLNGWLFGISAPRVSDDVRARLILYQRECYRVLADHFVRPPAPSVLSQVEALGHAIVALAQEQQEFERRLGDTEIVAQASAISVVELQRRMDEVEARTGSGEFISEGQASDVSQAVKAVALRLSKLHGRSASNQFALVYAELYRRFRVGSYRRLRQDQFDEVMSWLEEWRAELG
ncbi:MAG: ORF6C domain-containing protein [Anaerolineales bacterium]|nr:ORF6C domain-containing protein [Anaerolineales bacterium]